MESKLRGSLIEKTSSRESGISIGDHLIQRDGETEFVVESINDKQKVLLRSLKDNSTVLKNEDNLITQLKTPGSAWKRKE